jgi:hypothetical protein
MRTGQGELANRRIQPLCHLSAEQIKQLRTKSITWLLAFAGQLPSELDARKFRTLTDEKMRGL